MFNDQLAIDGVSVQEEGWAVCKVFKKRLPTVRRMSEHGSPYWYDDRSSFMPDLQSPNQSLNPTDMASSYHRPPYPCKRDLGIHYQLPPEHLLHLPFLENPKLLLSPFGLDVDQSTGLLSSSSLVQEQNNLQPPVIGKLHGNHKPEAAVDQVTDWRVLDKFVASQLSHDEGAPEVNANGTAGQLALMKADVVSDDASMQTSASCEMELWK
ncbi:hypothetical protein SAY87_019376 [Trapa incisa]|uniref:Uncharacterized protein n=1 Tax=Trapa incisa TaxID=236973 RepID=A0AAN7Q780_9MYRT|nr:hypothetical protein SAY87_019376 [Trapa incisa]